MINRIKILGLLLFLIELPVFAAQSGLRLNGALYEIGSNRKQKLYSWELTKCPGKWTSKYTRPDGSLVVEDELLLDGKRISEYRYTRPNIGERSRVKVEGSSLHFNYHIDEKSKSDKRSTEGTFLVGPAVFSFIEDHMTQLQAGEEFKIKYGVLDMLDYFTFKLSNDTAPDADKIRIKMQATNLVVRMAIKPTYVTLSKTGKFISASGRTLVMEKEKSKFMPIDAELVAESEAATLCGSGPTPEKGANL